jgi:hypothetical protein
MFVPSHLFFSPFFFLAFLVQVLILISIPREKTKEPPPYSEMEMRWWWR